MNLIIKCVCTSEYQARSMLSRKSCLFQKVGIIVVTLIPGNTCHAFNMMYVFFPGSS